MSRRWLMIAGLLCPACATGSGPPPLEDTETIPKEGAPDASTDPPATGAEGSGGAGESGKPDPGTASGSQPASGGSDGAGGAAPAPGGQGSGSGGSQSSALDCQALWAVVDTLGCTLVELVCSALEEVSSAGAEVPCGIAVPLACGVTSAATVAATALCPRP